MFTISVFIIVASSLRVVSSSAKRFFEIHREIEAAAAAAAAESD
jgi:hypothetical protein